jgi:hypothetical protein
MDTKGDGAAIALAAAKAAHAASPTLVAAAAAASAVAADCLPIQGVNAAAAAADPDYLPFEAGPYTPLPLIDCLLAPVYRSRHQPRRVQRYTTSKQ